jgi:broad specificity phosphatase PhoE
MSSVLLVRHGQSAWNAEQRWQGWADAPLSDLGRQQAKAAAGAIGAVDAIAASDLGRAMETATIIAGELGVGPVVVEADLRERSVGEFSGLTRDEIGARWPEMAEAFATGQRDHPMLLQPPGGESPDQVLARALPALRRVAALGETVVAVSHGGLIGALERHLGAEHVRIPNLGARWFHVDGGQIEVGDRLVLIDEHQVHVTRPPEL